MSALATVTAPPFVPLAVELPRDAASRAVLDYFEAERRAATTATKEDESRRADTFDHLVAIGYLATRPYFVPDNDGGVAATWEWIQEWVLRFLARYRGKSPDELIAAADNDEFRYLGRLCRLRLLDAIRSRTTGKNVRPPHVSLETPIADGITLLDCIGTDRQDAPSSLATGTGFEAYLSCVSNVFRAVIANRKELARLDLLDGLSAILANAEHVDKLRTFNSRVTQSIANARGVSLQAARAYRRKVVATMARELAAGNRAVRAVFLEVEPERGGMPYRTESAEQTERWSAEDSEAFFLANGCAWDDPEAN